MSGLDEATQAVDTSTEPQGVVESGLGTSTPETVTEVSILNNDGTFKEGWTKNLSPDYQDFGKLSNYKDINSLVGSLVNADRTISKGLEKMPNEDSTPEEWDALYSKLGRPESADKYELNTKDLGIELDEGTQEWYKNSMHELGVSNDKANAFLSKYAELEKSKSDAMVQEAEAFYKEEADKYIQEVGQREYDSQLNSAGKVLQHFPKLKDMIVSDPALNDNPTLIKSLATIGGWISEDKLTKGTSQMLQQPVNTQMDLKEQLSLAIKTGDKAKELEVSTKLQKVNMQMLDSLPS